MQNQIYRGVFYTHFQALASDIKKDSKLNYRGISYFKSNNAGNKSNNLLMNYRGLSYKKIVS